MALARRSLCGTASANRGHAGQEPLTPEQQALVCRNVGLVRLHLRNRVRTPRGPHREREYADLFQEGCVALMRAAARWNPASHGEFAPFALQRIRGRIFAALHSEFTLMQLPRQNWKGRNVAPQILAGRSLASTPGALAPAAAERAGPDRESLRHLIRSRYDRAVHGALLELRAKPWNRRDPRRVFERIASERLCITRDRQRTPLRRLAADEGFSIGRVGDYDRILRQTAAACFDRDPQVALLVRFAARNPAGFGAIPDHAQMHELETASARAFALAFSAMQPNARAKVLYSLLRRSSDEHAVALNLYRLHAPGEDPRTLALS